MSAFTTAYISFSTDTGGGFDGNGNPLTPVVTETAYVPCNSKTINREYKVLEDGQYVQARYQIYINDADVPVGINIATVKKVTLKNLDGVVLGKYIVNNHEPLRNFKKNKLLLV